MMNRRNKVRSDLELFEYLSDIGYALGTDFIVGHPGETQELWQEAMDNLEHFPLTHIHSFTYSKRDGTPSATMPIQVNGNIAKQRLRQLEAKIAQKNLLFRQKQSKLDVLVESKKDNIFKGYDQFFNSIEITSDSDLIGNWVQLEDYTVAQSINKAIF